MIFLSVRFLSIPNKYDLWNVVVVIQQVVAPCFIIIIVYLATDGSTCYLLANHTLLTWTSMIPSALFQADGCVGEYVGEYVGECVASITKDRILIQDGAVCATDIV